MNSRRSFLAGGAAALSASALHAAPARYATRVALVSDGLAAFDFLLWNPFLNPQPDFSGLPLSAQIRVKNTFPYQGRDVLETLVYAVMPDGTTFPISLIYTQVDDIKVAGGAIAFAGSVISNPVPSPFGEIVGKPMVIGGAFDQTGRSTRFEFFGGMTAGSHVTIVPEARGSLEIRTPWNSL